MVGSALVHATTVVLWAISSATDAAERPLANGKLDVCDDGVVCVDGPAETESALAKVEMLQQHQHISSGAQEMMQAMLSPARGGLDKLDINPSRMTLVKSTFAISTQRMDANLLWKKGHLDIDRDDTNERNEDTGFDEDGICGSSARVQVAVNHDDEEFHVHGVFGEGRNNDRDGLDGLSVNDVEDIITASLGDMSAYSPWMDQHVAFYDNDINKYLKRFEVAGTSFLSLDWSMSWEATEQKFYSLIAQAAGTQEIYEIVSATEPERVDFHHNLPRHFFTQREVEYLVQESAGMVPINVARTTRNISTVKAFYKDLFDMEPLAEDYDASGDVGYVFFSHNAKMLPISRHVQYWYRGNQSTKYSTHYVEELIEAVNLKYLTNDPVTCWPIWGDNHYSISGSAPLYSNGLVQRLWERYDERGWGYKTFSSESNSSMHFTTYFPAPGGAYIEVIDRSIPMGQRTAEQWDPTYCYQFSCAAK